MQDMDMDVPFFNDDEEVGVNGDATPTPRGSRRESFAEIGGEDGEEDVPSTPVGKGKGKRGADEVEDGPSVRVTGAQRGKGKGKEPIRTAEDEDDLEDEIARGMDDVDDMNIDEEEAEEPAPLTAPPPKKRGPPKKVAVTPCKYSQSFCHLYIFIYSCLF